jgi:uncharacterized membrane protein
VRLPGVKVDFDVPAEVAYDYLIDPRNRPQWQSSLRSVELDDEGPVRSGMRWIDVTRLGPRPEMELVGSDRPDLWTERGRWRGVEAQLTLIFEAAGDRCRVHALFSITGRRLLRPVGPVLGLAGLPVVARDLKRAARLLSARAPEQ